MKRRISASGTLCQIKDALLMMLVQRQQRGEEPSSQNKQVSKSRKTSESIEK